MGRTEKRLTTSAVRRPGEPGAERGRGGGRGRGGARLLLVGGVLAAGGGARAQAVPDLAPAAAAPAESPAKAPATAPSTAPAPAAPPTAASDPKEDTDRYGIAWLRGVLTDYQRRYPTLIRLYSLGTSHEGRPILAAAIGRGVGSGKLAGRPAVLLNGAHHGIELLSVDAVMDAIDVLLTRSGQRPAVPVPGRALRPDPELDGRVRRFLEELVVWCVPEVNPDGVWAANHGNPRTGRKNGRDTNGNGRIDPMDGVDLNRNYPFRWGALGEAGSSSKAASYYYRGPAPGSEPETQAMMRLAESERFAAAISYHTGTVAVLAPYTIDNTPNPEPNEAWAVGEYVVAGLPQHPQKPWALRPKLYSVDGTDQDYYRHQHGTVALLVEGSPRDPRGGAERDGVLRALRATWVRLLERFVDGPSLSGTVTDSLGRPVVAEVALDEIAPRAGERWTTRCRDGRFDRFVPAPGRYTVRVRVAGREPVVRTVDIDKGRAPLEIKLEGEPPPAARCPPGPHRLK